MLFMQLELKIDKRSWVKSLTMSQSVGMLMFPKKVGGYVTFLEVNLWALIAVLSRVVFGWQFLLGFLLPT